MVLPLARTGDAARAAMDAANTPGVSSDGKVPSADRERLRELSQEFESVFLDLVMQSMRKTIQKGEIMDGGAGEDVFRSMLDSEYAKVISKQNLTGIAATIEKDLLKLLEIQNNANSQQQGVKSYQGSGLQKLEKQARWSKVKIASESEILSTLVSDLMVGG